jgi:hypothetical protein
MSVSWAETAAAQLQPSATTSRAAAPGTRKRWPLEWWLGRKRWMANPCSGQKYRSMAIPTFGKYLNTLIGFYTGQDVQVIGVIHSSRRLPRTPPG